MKYKRTITEVDLENTQNEAIREAMEKYKDRLEWAKMFAKAHFVVLIGSVVVAFFGNFTAWLLAFGYSMALLVIANTIQARAKSNFMKVVEQEIENGNANSF